MAPWLVIVLVVVACRAAHSQTYSWNVNAVGDWNDPTKWTPNTGFPNAVGHVANLTFNITAARTITIPSSVGITLGTLNIGDPTKSGSLITAYSGYTIADGGGATLTFDSAAGNAVLNKPNQLVGTLTANPFDTIAVPMILNDNLDITIGNNARLALTAGISESGGTRNVTIGGSASATLNLSGVNTYSGSTTVTAGTVRFAKAASLYNNQQGALAGSWNAANITFGSGVTTIYNVGGVDEFTAADIQLLANLGTATGGYQNGTTLAIDTANAVGGNVVYSADLVNPNGGAHAISLNKQGANTLTLSGNNSYTGTTTIAGGTVHFAKANSLYNHQQGSWTDTNFTVNSGSTALFSVGGAGEFDATDMAALLALGTSTGGFRSGSTVGFNTANAAGGEFSYATNLTNTNGGTNTLNVLKVGTNTLTLSGSNTYTGLTTVREGTLKITGSHIVTPATARYDIARVAGSTASVVLDGGTIDGQQLIYVGTEGGNGTFTQNSGNVTVSGTGSPELYVGYGLGVANTVGKYDLLGGSVTVNGWTNIGRDGATGVFNNAATFTTTQELRVGVHYTHTGGDGTFNNTGFGTVQAGELWIGTGSGSGSTGHFNQTGSGSVNVNGGLYVGDRGTGFMTQSDGSVSVGGGSYGLSIGLWDNGNGTYANGTYTQTGGSLTVTAGDGMTMAYDPGTTGAYTINGSGATLNVTNVVYVGRSGSSGTFNLLNGTVTIGGYLSNGKNAGSSGTSNISGGSLTVTGDYNVGDYGSGTLNMTDGSITTSGGTGFVIGFQSGGSGTATVSGGTISATASGSDVRVGNAGFGTLNQSGGTISSSDWSYVGTNTGGNGTFNLSGGDFVVGDNLSLGNGGGSTGHIEMTGGNITVIGNDAVTAASSSFGTGNLCIGRNGVGTMNVGNGTIDLQVSSAVDGTGGTFNSVTSSFALNTAGLGGELRHAKDGNLYVGERTGSGQLVQSGGVINVGANVFVGGFVLSGSTLIGATGTLTISGGELHVGVTSPTGGDFVLGSPANSPASTATVNLQGGLLDVSHGSGTIGSGGGGTLAFNFTGGTLKMKQWNSNLAGGDLGPLVQSGAGSVLDVSGNNTVVNGGYNLTDGTTLVGKQLSINGDANLSSGGEYQWQLGALTTTGAGTDFGVISVNGNLVLDGTSKLDLDFTLLGTNGPTSANAFWATNHSWKIIDTTSNTGGTNFASLLNATFSNGSFSTSVGTGADLGDIFLTYSSSSGHIPGDFNNDGAVDGADFVAWQTNFPLGSGATRSNGDSDADGDVDGADFAAWQSSFNASSGGTNPIPEPVSVLPLFLGGIIALARHRIGRLVRR